MIFGKSFLVIDCSQYIRMSGKILVANATILRFAKKFHGLFKPCGGLDREKDASIVREIGCISKELQGSEKAR